MGRAQDQKTTLQNRGQLEEQVNSKERLTILAIQVTVYLKIHPLEAGAAFFLIS